eukprot:6300336-Pyramimonas_sp.AAC.1
MQVLAVICNMYRAKRFFQTEGNALESSFPMQGILAGCPFAAFLVQVYSYGPVSKLQQDLGRSDLFLVIGDWMILNQDSDPRTLVTRTVESSAQVFQLIQDALQCAVAYDKSAVVASSDSIRHDLARSMGKHMKSEEISAANPGVDTTGCQLRCRRGATRFLKERIKKLNRRKRRLAAIRKGGANMQRVYLT